MSADGSTVRDIDLDARKRLEAALLSRRKGRAGAVDRIPRIPRDAPMPLSQAQRAIWFSHLSAPTSQVWNVIQADRLRGPLDVAALSRAIADSVARHEVLRLRFSMVQNAPVAIAGDAPAALRLHDAGGLSPAARDAEALRLADAASQRPFDLSAQAPFRADLHRFGEDDHLLVFVVHHIACDEWSIRTLRAQIMRAYEARARGAPLDLPAPDIQYADVAAWEKACGERGAWDAALDRRAAILDGAGLGDTLAPTRVDRVAPSRAAPVERRLSPALVEALDAVGRSMDATPFMTMLAGALGLLHLQTGRDDLTIATLVAGRSRRETVDLIGPFTNTVAVRSRCGPATGFDVLLGEVRGQMLDALAHQEVRFETLLQRMRVAHSAVAAPYARVVFTHRKAFERLEGGAGLTSTSVHPQRDSVKFDLWVSLIDDDDGRLLRLVYDASRYDAAAMEAMARAMEALLESVVQDPARPLRDLGAVAGIVAAQVDETPAVADQAPEGPCAAPATERALAEVWRQALGSAPQGPEQSFFDAGGDSLLLMRLAHLIEEDTGLDLPLTDIFAAPTIRAMARRIEALRAAPAATPPPGRRDRLIQPLVVEARPGPARPRYFFLAGGGGHVAPFSPVAALIDARWEGLGVLDPALFDDEPTIKSIENLAARMAAAIRSVDPVGPYLLAGYSAGGRTVHEIARQLRSAGAEAGCVVLDAGAGSATLRAEIMRLSRMAKRYGRVALRRFSDGFAAARAGGLQGVEAERRRYRRISDHQHGRLLRHRVAASDTPVALVRAVGGAAASTADGADHGWPRVARLVAVIDTPGNHFNCFKGAHAPDFARALDLALGAVWTTLRGAEPGDRP